MTDVVSRALQTSGVPCLLEQPGRSRHDSRKPDGIKRFAYKHGKPLYWDCTCVYTFAPSHVIQSAGRAGSAANGADTIKRTNYTGLRKKFSGINFR